MVSRPPVDDYSGERRSRSGLMKSPHIILRLLLRGQGMVPDKIYHLRQQRKTASYVLLENIPKSYTERAFGGSANGKQNHNDQRDPGLRARENKNQSRIVCHLRGYRGNSTHLNERAAGESNLTWCSSQDPSQHNAECRMQKQARRGGFLGCALWCVLCIFICKCL